MITPGERRIGNSVVEHREYRHESLAEVWLAHRGAALRPDLHRAGRWSRGEAPARSHSGLAGRGEEVDLAASEYRFAPVGEGAFAAPNRAGDLRARVAGRGVEVESRTSGAAAFRLELGLVRAGRDGALADVTAGVAELSGDHVEIRRPGTDIVEWFANDERGVEQGWQILAAPAGTADPSHPLVLELGGFGSLRPLLRPQDGRVVFVDGTGAGRLLLRRAGREWTRAGSRVARQTLAVARRARAGPRRRRGRRCIPIAIDPLIQPAELEPRARRRVRGPRQLGCHRRRRERRRLQRRDRGVTR